VGIWYPRAINSKNATDFTDWQRILSVVEWDRGSGTMGLKCRMKDSQERVIGAALEVHKLLGSGLPESVCERAHELELTGRQYP
jgi:hypothetical protein